MTYKNWDLVNNQPNNKGTGEHFLFMTIKIQVGKWCDQPNASSQYKASYICEWITSPNSNSINPGTPKAGTGKSTQAPKAKTSTKSTIDKKNLRIFWEGKWTIEKDELVSQGLPLKRQRLVFGDPAWTDYDFKVEAMLERSDGGGMERYIECFNSIPPEKESHWTLNFGGWGPTNLDLRALVPGEEEYKTASRRWMPDKTHGELGKWTLVEIQARKDKVTVLVDGQTVATSTHPMLTRGCIGIGTHHSGRCRWRNFEVRAADGTVLWTGLPKQN